MRINHVAVQYQVRNCSIQNWNDVDDNTPID